MDRILIALCIGAVAGTIDALPMLIAKLPKRATLSAFLHYLVLGLVIPFVDWGIPLWLSGLVISFLSAVPVMIIVYPTDKNAILPMLIFSIVLGIGIGFAGARFVL